MGVPLEPLALGLVVAIVFLATVLHATVGFGTALVAMPLLAFVIDLRTATPLVALVMLTTIVALFWHARQHLDLRAAWQLALASAFGIPLGLVLVRTVPESGLKTLLGILLIGFGLHHLTRPRLPTLESRLWVVPFGLAAGILGGAYNTNGPPIVLYGALRRWSPDRFRATIQGFFLPAAIMICAGHALGGLWSHRVFALYAASLPAIAAALLVGLRVGRRIPTQHFDRVLFGSLVVLGVLLVV